METTPAPPSDDLAPNGWPWWVLKGFKRGEVRALTDVYRQHVGLVTGQLRYGFAFASRGRQHRFVGFQSAFELQDALHETFRRAFEPKARQAYDGIRPYGPYLKTIARNVVLRGFRAREVQFPEVRGGDDDDGGPMELADTDSATPEQSVAAQQVRSVVASYLETLTDADRKLLELRFIEGKSQRDAAEQLGLGRQQVRGRETKLRRGMLDYLRTQGELGLVEGATLMAGLSWLAALPLGAEPDLVVQCVHRWLRIVAPWGGGV